jgi:GNAT superfamily N-acetyltransferase
MAVLEGASWSGNPWDMSLGVRPAVLSDVPRLVSLNAAAYPELVADGVVFDAAQLMAQHAVFPEGQVVVEDDGMIVGAISTLIVPGDAASAPHTWVEITSHGTFAAHDPKGDTLYLADIYVAPAAQGRGVGAALYNALFRLCERRRLARVVAGGRLWGYHEVAQTMTPSEYVDAVCRGLRRDRVLVSQLRAGFVVRGILPGYLEDWRSAGHATHLFWENPLVTGQGRSSLQRRSLAPDAKTTNDRGW